LVADRGWEARTIKQERDAWEDVATGGFPVIPGMHKPPVEWAAANTHGHANIGPPYHASLYQGGPTRICCDSSHHLAKEKGVSYHGETDVRHVTQ